MEEMILERIEMLSIFNYISIMGFIEQLLIGAIFIVAWFQAV